MYKVCIIVISDKEYTGEEEDVNGNLIEKYLKDNKFNIALHSIVPEKKEILKNLLIKCCDEYGVDLIITIGNISIANNVNKEIEDRTDLEQYTFNNIDGGSSYFFIRGNTAIINFSEKVKPEEIPLETIDEVLKIL